MKKPLPATNMIVLNPSRERPRPGDLFVVNMLGERWVAGRVVHTDANMMGGGGNETLLYFYKREVPDPNLVRPPLKPDLLIPPVITNFLGWKHGYFKTVGNYPLTLEERLPRHYFLQSLWPVKWDDPKAIYCDEFHVSSPRPFPGDYWTESGLCSYRWIDDHLSNALGIPPVPEEKEAERPTHGDVESSAKELDEACTVTFCIPTDGADDGALEDIESRLQRQIKKANAGDWEGHGFDLERKLFDIRFTGPSGIKLASALRKALQAVTLPAGSYATITYDSDSDEQRLKL